MKMDQALESLGYLIKTEEKVEKLSFRMIVNGETKSVQPLGFGVHTASAALTAIVTATNVTKDHGIEITEVFFRRFEG